MSRFVRLLSALSAFFVLAVVVASCGNSVAGNAVANVDGKSITTDTFDHWLRIAAFQTQGVAAGGTNANVVIPKPPAFAACVAKKTATAPKPAKGQPVPTPTQFKTQCQQEYASLRDQVMSYLIRADWIQGEADSQGVKLSSKDLDTAYNNVVKQAFTQPTAAARKKAFDKFLSDSATTTTDLRFRVMVDTLSTKLTAKITKDASTVTDDQISAYYAKNKTQFSSPEKRDLRIVLAKTLAGANQAKSAVQSGSSWKAVSAKFSIDQASKAQGGVMLNVAKGTQEPALDTAIFKATKGQLTGPVKTQFGYYVFQVQKTTAATSQTLAQAKASIKQLLSAQNQQTALTKFATSYQKKWKAKTNCASGFAEQDCKNAPKIATTTAPVTPVQPSTTTTG